MDKYIGFDIDSKKITVFVVEKCKKEGYMTVVSNVQSMRNYLESQKTDDSKIHFTFEISGQEDFLYDFLIDCADTITVSNPSKMTWLYLSAKKNDRIGACKMAVLLSIREVPSVYMPFREER